MAWLDHVTHLNFGGPNYMLGMAEARVVKSCTQLGHAYQYDERGARAYNGVWGGASSGVQGQSP